MSFCPTQRSRSNSYNRTGLEQVARKDFPKAAGWKAHLVVQFVDNDQARTVSVVVFFRKKSTAVRSERRASQPAEF